MRACWDKQKYTHPQIEWDNGRGPVVAPWGGDVHFSWEEMQLSLHPLISGLGPVCSSPAPVTPPSFTQPIYLTRRRAGSSERRFKMCPKVADSPPRQTLFLSDTMIEGGLHSLHSGRERERERERAICTIALLRRRAFDDGRWQTSQRRSERLSRNV